MSKYLKECTYCGAPTTGQTPGCRTCGYKRLSLMRMGEGNPMWKGDKVGINPLHRWVVKRLPKPELCQECNQRPSLDLANKGVYDRNLENWEWLCRRCHMTKDGRINNLKQDGHGPRYFGCKAEGCEGVYRARGYCDKHYQRFKRYGYV